MENNSSFTRLVYALALVATLIGIAAFSQTPKENSFRKEQRSAENDTTSPSTPYRNDDIRSLDQFDIEMKKLDVEMNHLHDVMKSVDLDKIQIQLDETLKRIDSKKIAAEVDESLKKVNWGDINKQIEKSIAPIDEVELAELKKEMEKVRDELSKQILDVHIKAPHVDVKKIKIETANAMKNAKLSMKIAKEEVQNLRDFTSALQQDFLIDKSKAYKIRVKDGELYINGQKQPKEVSDKYQRFYKRKDFSITINEKNSIEL